MGKRYLKLFIALTLSLTMCLQNVSVYAAQDKNVIMPDETTDVISVSENESAEGCSDDIEITDDTATEAEETDDEIIIDEQSDYDNGTNQDIGIEETEESSTASNSFMSVNTSGFTYKELNGSYAAITGYTGNEDTLEIPSVIDGFIVQKISDGAFKESHLKSVIIPDSVVSIGVDAFKNCSELEEIIWGSNVENIGNCAFEACKKLKQIEFPAKLTGIGSYAFYNCTGLTKLEIPDSVNAIYGRAFYNCTNLSEINYPISLSNAGEEIFANTKLTRMTVPEGVTKLADRVFKNCTNFIKIQLPATLKSIGNSSLEGCTDLTELELPEGLTSIGNWGMYNCTGLTELELPDGITNLGKYSLANCSNLSKVNYPKSLNSTGEGIFNGDSKLKSIIVPEGVETIPDSAFKNCSNFAEIRLPETLKTINGGALEGCTGLKSIRLPEGLTSIGNWAMYNCTGLTELELPDGVKNLGKYSLASCSNLSKVNYPKSLNSTGEGIFNGDSKLKSITVPEGVETLPNNAFRDANYLTRISLPMSLKVIESSAFEGCSTIERMILPENLTTIGSYAFCNCPALELIWVGEGVTSIHDRSFEGCSTAKLVFHGKAGSYAQTWSEGKGYAFDTGSVGQTDAVMKGKVIDEKNNGIKGVFVSIYDCNRLKTVYTGYSDEGGVWSYDEAVEGNTYKVYYTHVLYKFEKNVIQITASQENEIETVRGTRLYNGLEESDAEDFTYATLNGSAIKITAYSGNSDTVVIPANIDGYTVQELGDNVFKNKIAIKCVILPEGMNKIGSGCFYGCTALEDIRFSSTVSNIGNSAFESCKKLTQIEFPAKLTGIGSHAFYNCTGLTKLEIPDSVNAIYGRAFYNCTNLSEINYPMSLSNAGEEIFANTKLTRMTVPEGVTKLADRVFKNCTNFIKFQLPGTLKTIGGSSLEGCTGLTELELPESLTSIGNWGMYNCTGLTELELPDGVTHLGRYSLANCSNLSKVNYPKSLNSTGDCIFNGDSKLKSIIVPEGIETLPDSAFKNCSNFAEIRLPETLKTINGGALEGCTGLKSIRLPEGLTSIGNWGMYNCTGLTELELPDGITNLGRYSLANCSNLSKVNYPKSLNSTGEGIFNGDSKLKSITVPEGVETLPNNAFKSCNKLRYIYLPDTLAIIGDSAFEGCIGLPSITLPDSVHTIGAYAFYGCMGFINTAISNGVETVGRYAYANCSNLTKVYVSKHVSKMDKTSFAQSSKITFYCDYYSYATIYAIENNIPFSATGIFADHPDYVLNRTVTSYYGDFNSMTANGYVAMTVKYDIKDSWKSDVSDMKVNIKLPSNTELDESTLKVDGVLCTNYNYDDDRALSIPVINTSGTIKYSVKITKQADTTSYATLSFKKNGISSMEIIGIVNEEVSIFTIDVPDIISDETFQVSGMAPASGKITLKVGNKEHKMVTASKAGIWSTTLKLDNPVDYATYTIIAVCSSMNGQTSETKTASVTYHEGEPSLNSLKMYYNEHDITKVYDLADTNGITPLVYYLPGTKFVFEANFDNADQIDELYITSTRNNETKYLKATYDQKKEAFVTDGYFDESNHNYIPGVISYEYSKPAPTVTVGQSVDWDDMINKLPESAVDNVNVKKHTGTEYEATIDLSAFGDGLKDVAVDASISILDAKAGTDLGVWKGLLDENDKILSYMLPGYDDEKYICNLDYTDEGTWLMLVKDVTGNKYIGLALDTAMDQTEDLDAYWTLSNISSTLSTVNKSASLLYKNYQIEQDMDKLRKEVMSSGHYSSSAELNKALKLVDDLENDQKMFLIMTTILPLILAAPVTVGATMSAAPMILFTAMLGAITASSTVFWSIRKANIKGEKYKSKFVIDPSGYVYDTTTGERLDNVTVTAYCIEYDESDDFWNRTPSENEFGSVWNASEYNQQNPLLTNEDGKYAWDVPEGWWRVKYEKDGYETAWSSWMTVPPLQTEVNIGLKPKKVEVVEHIWDEGTVQIKPTCVATGIISYECKECHVKKTEILPIDIDNHNEVTDKAVAVTCTSNGKTEGSHCLDCGKVIVGQTVIPARGHLYKTTTTKATTKKNGSVVKKCTVCGDVASSKTIYYPKTITLSKTSFVYSGKVQRPTVSVKGSNGKTITSSNYTVTYSSGCKNVGKYTVKLTLKGYYSGSISKTYTIIPKGTAISGLTAQTGGFAVKWKKQSTQTTGYQIQYSTSGKFTSAKTVTVSKNSTVSKTISKLSRKRKYYVRIRTYKTINRTNYYSAWSSAKSVTTKK